MPSSKKSSSTKNAKKRITKDNKKINKTAAGNSRKKNQRKRKIKEIENFDDNSHNKNQRKRQKINPTSNNSNSLNANEAVSKKSTDSEGDIVKSLVKDLTPWSIKQQIILHARIIYKSKSIIMSGKRFFFIILMDETHQLMRMNFWENQRLKFQNLKKQDVIMVKEPTIRQTNKKFQIYQKYQLLANRDTKITTEKTQHFPQIIWNFVNIIDLLKEPDEKLIDVKARCAYRYDVENITSSRGNCLLCSFFLPLDLFM